MGSGSSKIGGGGGSIVQKPAGGGGAITPDAIMKMMHNNPNDSAMRNAIYSLRDNSADDVTDNTVLTASIGRTLQKVDSEDGVAKIWWQGSSDAARTLRSDVLNVLGNGYEFVELTNSNRGNLFGTAMRANIKSWRLRKKRG